MYKKLFALSITSTLSISSLIGTGIVLLNQNNNKNLVTHYNYNKSSKKSQSIEEAEKQGIKIRTNPINGFDSLDVSNGNKLVLTTVEKDNELKTYGVALVNFVSNEMLDHWEIPNGQDGQEFVKNYEFESDREYVTNYTTNIIPGNNANGNNANEFFVLAGISNLADALNTVYTEYNEGETTFEKVVGADKVKVNLKKAPSIKIFKLKIKDNNTLELNKQAQDGNKGYYDFKYPEFDNKHKKGGLKFYTETGVFASLFAQQYSYAYDSISYGMGYLQYLQYGQLFQVNYENKDKDEFALINSWLSNDVSMGNLYAFYSSETKSLAPALSIIKYFYDDALKPMIDDPGNNKPYQPEKSGNTTDYQIITEFNGKPISAPESDQLNKNTALALAFMYDFYAGQQTDDKWRNPGLATDKQPTIGSPLSNKKKDRPYYGFVPGWFVFRPSDNYLIYGNMSDNAYYHDGGNRIWGTAIGSYWNSSEEKYYLLMVRNWWWSERIKNVEFIQIDLFADSACSKSDDPDNKKNYGTFHVHYDESSIKIFDYIKYDDVKNKSHATKPMFIKVIDNEKNIVAIATNATNQILISKKVNEKHETYLTNMTNLSNKNRWLNMQYNKQTDTLTAINNEKIVTFVINNYNNDNVKTHPYTISSDNIYVSINDVTNINGAQLRPTDNNTRVNAFSFKINNGFSKSGTNVENFTNFFMIQTQKNISNEKTSLLDIITPSEVGYFETCTIDELDGTIKQKSIDDLMLATMKELKDFFVKNEYKKGTMREIVGSGIKIVNDSEIINGTEIFRLSSVIQKSGKYMIGFTLLDGGQIKDIVSGNAKYNVKDFHQEKRYVVFKQDIMNSQIPYKNKSVAEIKAMFKNKNNKDIENFKRSIINLIIDETESNLGDYNLEDFSIIIDDENTSESGNTIAFFVIHSESGKIMEVQDINNSYVKKSFRFNDIFAKKLSSTTITWIAVGTTLGVLAFIGLGVGIGIPVKKNSQKIDTLTTAIAKVFSKMNDINIRKRTPVLLQNKKPSGYIAANRPKAITTSKSNVGPQRFVSLKTYSTANSAKTANVGLQRFVPLKTVRNHPDNRNKPTVSDWPKRGL